MEHRTIVKTIGIGLLGGMSLAAFSNGPWLLMARHGECVELERIKRKIPELTESSDPHSFVKLMREKGYAVTSSEVPGTEGKAVEVKVPGRDLSLIFATRDLCQKPATR